MVWSNSGFKAFQVLKDAKSFLLANVYKSVCANETYASIRKRYGC